MDFDSQGPGKKKPKTTGRWDDVREEALTLLSERGYHGTTMKLLAARLGVQAPSLYNHVGSKQEILSRIMVTGIDRLLAGQDKALNSSSDPAEQLRAMTESHVLIHIRHRRSAVTGDRELANLAEPDQSYVRSARDRYEHRVRQTIAKGVKAGVFSVSSEKLASFAVIEMASSVSVWFRESGPLEDLEVAREYGKMALRIVAYRPAIDTAR